MKRYFTSLPKEPPPPPPPPAPPSPPPPPSPENVSLNQTRLDPNEINFEADLNNLPSDPGLRPRIMDYPPKHREIIRRYYLEKGPCQPYKKGKKLFPATIINNKPRRFCNTWYKYSDCKQWLEYSIVKDGVYCLYCYLYGIDHGEQGGGDCFVVDGFRNWKKKDRLLIHAGVAHNLAYEKGQDLLNQRQHIEPMYVRNTDQSRLDYRIRLNASVGCARFLLRQGLAFRGHNESYDSNNQGNFIELLKYTADQSDTIKNVVLQNAPKNNKLIAPEIQKDIVCAAARETTKAIMEELGDSLFAILIDESRYISIKEQMAVVLRYVNKNGCLVERFLGIVHVKTTTAVALKVGIEALFSRHNLSITRLRDQGYDGASNMQGEFNGLKTLIMKENASAFYIHCFSHQLQLALVAAAKNLDHVSSFFIMIASMVNITAASCKRKDILREKEAIRIHNALLCGELTNGQGLNQEMSFKRPGDTRWGSHYGSLINLICMFSSVIEVLDHVVVDGYSSDQIGEARTLLNSVQSFDFILILHLMAELLGITNDLSKALQRQDQDIVNAMTLVDISKKRIQMMRDDGWDTLMVAVSSFCLKNNILVPDMSEQFVASGRSRRNASDLTNLQYFRGQLFYRCIDTQIAELNNRFNEVTTELLLCIACLNSVESFAAFDKEKVTRLTEFYPNDFDDTDRIVLQHQMENYIMDVRSNSQFLNLNKISDLAKKMVETKKSIAYPLVFLLITLALVLPVATATVERAFSAMHIIKNKLRNRMGDEYLNDSMITYIEKDIFNTIDDEAIMQRFQNMDNRRGHL